MLWKLWCWRKLFKSPLVCKEIKPVNPKGNQTWIFIGKADAEAPLLWPPDVKNWFTGKKPWCWERLKAGGEGDNRGWGGWMASAIRWTWVWASSGRWWWAGKPGVLQSIGSQRVGYNWASEQNWSAYWRCSHSTNYYFQFFNLSLCGFLKTEPMFLDSCYFFYIVCN